MRIERFAGGRHAVVFEDAEMDGLLIEGEGRNKDKLKVEIDQKLDRAEVAELVTHLQRWLNTGSLAPQAEAKEQTT